jgi:DNA-binding beta-propeller fold protein YncE
LTVSSGGNTTVSIQLSAAAPSGGAVISLTSGNPTAFPLPASYLVPAGQLSISFTNRAGTVTSLTSVTLTATYNGSSQPTQVSVNPALSASFNYAQLTLGSGFSGPSGVAVDNAGNVFVADTDNNAVKEIMAAGGYTTVNTLAAGLFAAHN